MTERAWGHGVPSPASRGGRALPGPGRGVKGGRESPFAGGSTGGSSPRGHTAGGRQGVVPRGSTALPVGLVLAGAVSVQAGAGIASRLFSSVPPAAVTTLRLWAATLIMVAVAGRGTARVIADVTERRAWSAVVATASFGIGLGLMNFAIYQAFARIPLGIAVTTEFLGPLAVAIAALAGYGGLSPREKAARKLRSLVWVALAAAGVLLLARGSGGHLNMAGVAWGLVAAAGWAAYILLSKATGQRMEGASGLVLAMGVAALLVTVPGVVAGGRSMFRPVALGEGAAIGLLSSVVPYWLELEALRRVPARVFGVWMSLQPAVAALIGLVMLGQRLSVAEWAGIACVVIASAGAARGTAGAARGAAGSERGGRE
jgi:inner membrane transporter RhtA